MIQQLYEIWEPKGIASLKNPERNTESREKEIDDTAYQINNQGQPKINKYLSSW